MKDELLNTISVNGKLVSKRCNKNWMDTNGHSELWEYLNTNTQFLPENSSVSERVYCLKENITTRQTCKYCPKPVSFVRMVGRGSVYSVYCSKECSKHDLSDLIKVGKSSISHESIMVSNDKRKLTNLKNTGYEYNSQRPDVKIILKQKRYKELDDAYIIDQYTNYGKTSVQLGIELGVFYGTILERLRFHNITVNHHITESAKEREICEFLDTIGVVYVRNDRSIIAPYELDIFIPSKNVAIEFNGLPWHCEEFGGKDKHYHLNKTLMCEKNNIKLVHVFSHKWESNRAKIESHLTNLLVPSKIKVNARDCVVEKLPNIIGREFFNANHIDGDCAASHYIGLSINGTVCAVMSFAKGRFDKGQSWEIIRFACLSGYSVRGGIGKLVSHFNRTKNDELPIITFVDLSLSNGSSYVKAGFGIIGTTAPGYHYYKNNKVYSRMNFQKHKLESKLDNFNPLLSEIENMKINGYDRYWDCGNIKLKYNK